METVIKVYNAWKTTKHIALCPLVTFVAGWLTRSTVKGTIHGNDRPAAYILLGTSIIMVSILIYLGITRWKRNQLTKCAKVVLCLAIVALFAFFYLGWNADIE